MYRVFTDKISQTVSDIAIEPEIEMETSHSMTALNINNTYINISMIYGLTGNQTIRLVCKIGEKYLAANQTIVGGSISQIRKQSISTFTTPAALVSKAYEELLCEIRSEQEDDAKQTNSLNKRRPSISKKKDECFVENALRPRPSIHTPKNLSVLSVKTCPNTMDSIEQLKSILKRNNFDEFTKISKKANKNYITIREKRIVHLVKCYSISCGNHDRYHASKIQDPSKYTDMEYLSSKCEHVINDMMPMVVEKFSQHDIDTVNRAISKKRSIETWSALENAGCSVGGKNPALYEYAQEVTYYREGRNGRPDLVLLDVTGGVVGVVEIKKVSTGTFNINKTTYMKQVAHLHQMFKAVESYLVVLKPPGPKSEPIVEVTTSELRQKVDDNLRIALNNFEAFRSAVLGMG